jgi:hypothetical protein
MQLIFRLFFLIKKSEKYFPDLLLSHYDNFTENIRYILEGIHENFDKNLNFMLGFIIENQHQIAFTSSIIFSIFLVVKLTKIMLNKPKISNTLPHDNFLNIDKPKKSVTIFMRLFKQVWCSKFFWMIIGFCIHILWNMVQADFIRLIDLFITYWIEKIRIITEEITQDIPMDPIDQSFEYLNYRWFVTIFTVKLKKFLELLYNVL